MARVAIVGTASELPGALRALAAQVPGGVEPEVLGADELVARLTDGAAYEAVVVADVEDPVPLVQRVSRIDRDVAVCVLCAGGDAHRVRRDVQFAPFVGEEVSVRVRDGDGDPTLAAEVIEMAGRTAARRRHRETLDAATLTLAGLARSAPDPGSVDASIRRQAAFAALEQLVADAPVGVGLLDTDLRYVRVNAFIRRLAGRDVTGELLGDAVQPELGAPFREAAAAVLERGDPEFRREFEVPDPAKPGATAHILANVFPVRDQDGTVVGAAMILFDLTDQRHSQTLLAVQYEVARALAEERAAGPAARRIMAAVGRLLGWQLGALWRTDPYSGLVRFVDMWAAPDVDGDRFLAESRDFALPRGEGMLGGAWARGEPVWIADLRADRGLAVVRREFLTDLGFRTALAFPITVGGDAIAVMEFLSTSPRERDVDLLDVLETAGAQVGQFVERLSAEAELRRSERERERLVGAMLLAAGEQRRLIARDLHDDTIQVMTAVLLQLDRLARRLDSGGVEAVRGDLEHVRGTLAHATDRVRRLTFELRPQLLEAQGLAAAIGELAAVSATGAPYEIDVDVDVGRHRWGVEELVYRTVAEALANAREHSGASLVRVVLRERGGRVEGEVVDDGRGFDVARARGAERAGHLGIRPLGERVRLSGGDFRLESAPGEGTTVRFSVPFDAEAALPPEEDGGDFALHRQSEEWLALLDTLLDRAPIGLAFWDRSFRYVRLNGALAALNGIPVERHLGRTPAEVVPELWPALEPVFRAVLERGAEFIDLEVHGETPASPGVERIWLASYYPVQARGGDVLGIGAVVVDVTERKAAEAERNALLAEAQAARDRLALLSSVSGALAETIELTPTLEHVTRLVVETLADWCELDLLEDGELRPAGRAHADPGCAELLDRFHGEAHPWAEERRRTAAGRGPLVLADVGARIAGIADPELRSVAEALRPGPVVLVPLVTRGRPLGLLTCARTAGRRPYDADDVALAREIASRAAVAIDNARLFEHRSTVARTLQDRLLPPKLPAVPGLRLAARYEQFGAEVGGDFYDVFEMAEGEWGIVVGDVSGKGVGAAALTGLVRHTLRAVAGYRRQAGALAAVNRALVDEGPEQFCTLVFTRYRPGERGGRIELRLAGHPPPVLVRRDGTTELVGIPGTLLGFLDEPQITPAWVDLEPGDAVVLYTDGVTEAKRGADLFGEGRLAAVVSACAGLDADAIADEVVAAVRGYQQAARDDLTVLVLSVPPEEAA